MGYLDDLKKQAQGIRKEQQDPPPQEHHQAAVERALQLSLRLIYGYLVELVEHLNVVKPEVSVSYEIEGYGRIADLRQDNYTLQIDDRRLIGSITLSFTCGHPEPRPRVMRAPDRSAFMKQRDYLLRHGLTFDSKLAVSGEGTLLVEPMITVSLRFSPDPKARRIRFDIKNLSCLGQESYLIDPIRLNRQHLDGIAGLVLRKPDSLEKLTGPLITDDAKMRIRQALVEERKQQLRHDAEAAAISRAERKAEAETRIPARTRRATLLALGRLAAAGNALWKRLTPCVLSACRLGFNELKQVASKITARMHTRLLR